VRAPACRYSFFGAADDEELVGELGGDMDDGALVRPVLRAVCTRARVAHTHAKPKPVAVAACANDALAR
jgi:hypothetical protein